LLLTLPGPVGHVSTRNKNHVESQITDDGSYYIPARGSPAHSDDSKSDDEGGGGGVSIPTGYGGAFDDGSYGGNLFDVNVEDDFKDDRNGIHGFLSGNEFTVTERCSFYMDRAVITSNNRQAVEFVYMIEAETLCRGENTMRLPELKEKIIKRYKALICAIPATQFSEPSLQEQMCVRISNSKAKEGSAGGHYNWTVDAKSVVQDIIRSIPNLSKLPSGRDIIDICNSYILEKYKQEMGPVSFSLAGFCC
jgi:hypothetical protein